MDLNIIKMFTKFMKLTFFFSRCTTAVPETAPTTLHKDLDLHKDDVTTNIGTGHEAKTSLRTIHIFIFSFGFQILFCYFIELH